MRHTVPRALAGERVDRVVAMLCAVPRAEAAALVSAGAVRVGGEAVTGGARRLREGDELEVDVPAPAADVAIVPDPAVEVPIVHADDEVVVVDKPAGLVVHPGAGHESATLVHGLVARFPELAAVGDSMRPGIVHRLDAGTSGLLVVARTPRAHGALVEQLAARGVDRRYLALVWGHVDARAGMIDAPVGRSSRDRTRMAITPAGREARTRYEVIRTFNEPAALSLLECRLETGRTHQIRVHLAAIGHPVAGDPTYRGRRPRGASSSSRTPTQAPTDADALALERPFLHAHALAFDHPATRERVAFTSPLPPDLEAVHAALR